MLTWGCDHEKAVKGCVSVRQATERSEGGRLFDGWLSRTASGVVWLGRRETSAGLPRGSTTTIILQSRGNTPKDVFIRMKGGDTSDGSGGFVSSGAGKGSRPDPVSRDKQAPAIRLHLTWTEIKLWEETGILIVFSIDSKIKKNLGT